MRLLKQAVFVQFERSKPKPAGTVNEKWTMEVQEPSSDDGKHVTPASITLTQTFEYPPAEQP